MPEVMLYLLEALRYHFSIRTILSRRAAKNVEYTVRRQLTGSHQVQLPQFHPLREIETMVILVAIL